MNAGRPIIQNIVMTMNLGCSLWLPAVAKKLVVAEYNPARFSAVTFRITNPKSTALLFSSGKVVCTGTRRHVDAVLACYRYVHYLCKKLGIKANVYDLTVQNIVSSINLNLTIDLNKFARINQTECNYDPSLFPGAIWRSKKQTNSMVVLVFSSGRLVITGGKKRDDIDKTYDLILPFLQQAIKNDVEKGETEKSTEIDDIMNKLVYDGIIPNIS